MCHIPTTVLKNPPPFPNLNPALAPAQNLTLIFIGKVIVRRKSGSGASAGLRLGKGG